MPDMNSEEFDDLFRRAAEQYPLRTDSADWSKVARALDEESDDRAVPYVSSANRERKKLLWLLLLLIPIGLIAYQNWKPHGFINSGKDSRSGALSHDKSAQSVASNTDSKPAHVSPAIVGGSSSPAHVEASPNSASSSASLDKKGIQRTKKNRDRLTGSSSINFATKKSEIGSDNKISGLQQNTAGQSIASAFSVGHIGNKKHSNVERSISGDLPKSIEFARENRDAGIKVENSIDRIYNINAVPQLAGTGPGVIPGFDLASDPLQSIAANQPPSSQPHDKKPNHHAYLYGGVVVAPDLSTIKFQSLRGSGYSAGLLLGVQLSRRVAIETGAYFDSKKYYTAGEYFSSKNVEFLNYVDLLDVTGSCQMIEVPVNLKYNFITGKKTNWYATTGLSTYFMFKESYDYSYIYNGYAREKSASYSKGSQNWFSIVNFSIGYEHQLGRIGNLRIEPYLRIPMSGMGTGSLPIMSSGLNIGITRRIN